ncbi:ABC transporter permease [Mesoplasma seiffertii]|uniref:ABC transporter permease n=1 Tax=Mesoplasma seiffertii TaxID=28224 RepID=UPI00047B1DE4|nr:ABC transporter permease [Mesoplasma seiffertii]
MTTKLKKSDINLKKNTGIFTNLFKLVSKSFFRNPRGPLFMFIVPVFFMILFYFVLPQQGNIGASSLFGYTLLPALTILTSLAPAIVEWKNSVFLKRIDTTGVKKGMFLGAIWLFYLVVSLGALVFMILVAMAVGSGNSQMTFISSMKNVNWPLMILATIFVALTSIGIATLLGGLFSSEGGMQGIVMMIYFFSIFFSGIMIPPQVLMNSKFMIIFTYFVPHKYAVFLFLFAVQGKAAGWDSSFNKYPEINMQNFTATWQPVLGSILIIVTLFVATTLTFKWSAKK